HSSTLESIDFGQDPAFEVGAETETHREHLQRTMHLSTSTSLLPQTVASDSRLDQSRWSPDDVSQRRQ
ncbi:MAG TPA: hypothetical protein VES40_07000, partial [Ilumatobacteraceae bacterium]|nr:hypothetical protein [Ilumatobacteraceae bacterium]